MQLMAPLLSELCFQTSWGNSTFSIESYLPTDKCTFYDILAPILNNHLWQSFWSLLFSLIFSFKDFQTGRPLCPSLAAPAHPSGIERAQIPVSSLGAIPGLSLLFYTWFCSLAQLVHLMSLQHALSIHVFAASVSPTTVCPSFLPSETVPLHPALCPPLLYRDQVLLCSCPVLPQTSVCMFALPNSILICIRLISRL